MKKNRILGATMLAMSAYFLWGFTFLFSRLGMDIARPFVMLAHRYSVALIFMVLVLLIKGEKITLRGKRVGMLLLMGFLEPVVYFVGEAYGILYTSTAFSGIMVATIPILSMFASWGFLKEKPTVGQIDWSVISVAGVIVFALQGTNEGVVELRGVLCLLLAMGSTVAFGVMTRDLSQSFSASERTLIGVVEGAVGFWLLAVIQCRDDWSQLVAPLASGTYWIGILYLGAIGSVFCYFVLNYALAVVPVNRITIGSNLCTVVSVFAGIVFLHEPFSWISVGCSVVILLGIYGVQRAAPKEPKLPEAEHEG